MAIYMKRTASSVDLVKTTFTVAWYDAATAGTLIVTETYEFPVLDSETTEQTIADHLRRRHGEIEEALVRFTAIKTYIQAITAVDPLATVP